MRKTAATAHLVAFCIVGTGIVWTGNARAHDGYPLVVKSALQLTAIFDPSGGATGCYLCHTDPNGGSPLRPFGSTLVQNYGLSSDMVNEEDSSLMNALTAMEAGPDARLIEDIKKGVDPNTDPGTLSAALPVPEYGCSVASGPRPARGAAAALMGLAGLLLVRRRRGDAVRTSRS